MWPTTEACPECDNASLYKRQTKTPTWRCANGHEFDEPVVREVRSPGGDTTNSLDDEPDTNSGDPDPIPAPPTDTPDTAFADLAPGDKVALTKADDSGYSDPFVVCEIHDWTRWRVPFASDWVDADVLLASGVPSGMTYRAVVDPDGTVRLYRPIRDQPIHEATKPVAEIADASVAGSVSTQAYCEYFADDASDEAANPWRDTGRGESA